VDTVLNAHLDLFFAFPFFVLVIAMWPSSGRARSTCSSHLADSWVSYAGS